MGFAPNYGIFPFQASQFLTLDDVLEGADSNNAGILRCLKPSKDDAFMLEQSCKDSDQGFCSQPMRKTKLLAELKGRRFRLIPRCVITQANGNQRIIDDAARGGQGELSAGQNELVLCTPLRPAQHIAAVAATMPEELWGHFRPVAWVR